MLTLRDFISRSPGVNDRFEPVMSLHVYAVASELPKDSAQLWQVDYELKHAKFREAIQAGNEAPTETYVFKRLVSQTLLSMG